MATAENSLPRLSTAEEVAHQTGIPRWRVYDLARQGELPHIRFGRSIRFDPQAVRDRLASPRSSAD